MNTLKSRDMALLVNEQDQSSTLITLKHGMGIEVHTKQSKSITTMSVFSPRVSCLTILKHDKMTPIPPNGLE
jgi:hypothetical protein